METVAEINKLRKREQEILTLLYRFRFLGKRQIQYILGHNDNKRTKEWLRRLRSVNLIEGSYENNFAEASTVYSLPVTSRKYLMNLPDIQVELLNRVWREKNYSHTFKNHCLFLAQAYISLQELMQETNATLFFYTKVDLHRNNHLIKPAPDAYFAIEEQSGVINNYFLEILEDLPPKYLRSRAKQYLNYYSSYEWQRNNEQPFPFIVFVCSTDRMKSHLFYYIQNRLRKNSDLVIYLTTKDLIKGKGLRRENLQKVVPKP